MGSQVKSRQLGDLQLVAVGRHTSDSGDMYVVLVSAQTEETDGKAYLFFSGASPDSLELTQTARVFEWRDFGKKPEGEGVLDFDDTKEEKSFDFKVFVDDPDNARDDDGDGAAYEFNLDGHGHVYQVNAYERYPVEPIDVTAFTPEASLNLVPVQQGCCGGAC